MKFSCPSCSAKYQIADEKVAGRTVKMKCRKCGTVIPIRPDVTAHSIAAAPMVHAHSLPPRADAPAPPSIPQPRVIAEWHAGIAGSAQGPFTVTQLQDKIASGEVSRETYVWKESMDGWKPIVEVAELSGIFDAPLVAPGPPSMPAPAKAQRPVAAPPRVSPAAPVAKPLGRPTPAAMAAMHPPAPHSESSSGLTPQITEPVIMEKPPSQAPALSGGDGSVDEFDIDALKKAEADKQAQQKTAAAVAAASTSAFDAPIPDIVTAGEGPYVASQEHHHSYDSLVAQLQRKRHNPWVVPFAVVAALVLGVTVGFVLFGDQKTKIIKQVIEVPAKVAESTEHKKDIVAEVAAAEQAEEEAAQQQAPTKVASNSGSKAASANTETAPADTKVSEGLKGLSGLDGLNGPTAGPSANSGSTSGGSQLEASQIQSTVTQYQSSVKRGCWQPALLSRDKDAPSTARVTVTITVAPDGSVTSASATPDPAGYTGLSSCITSRVRGWRFPRAGGTTTVKVPFVFAAQ